MEAVYFTKEEFEKFKKELHQLKYVERPKIVQAITTAMEHGDLRENAEYTAAKEAQVLLEQKIARLELMQARTRIVDTKNMEDTKAHVGSKVTLLNLKTEETMKCVLASAADLDIYDMDVISLGSPVGKAILGKSVGDVIELENAAGKLQFKILEIL